MGYVIPVLIEKGGETKTTTAVHLAHALALQGVQVIVIDLDPQTHATGWLAPEMLDAGYPGNTVLEVLRDPELGVARSAAPTRIPGVAMLPGARALGMPESLLTRDPSGMPRDPFKVLRRALRDVPAGVVVLVDCPPSVGVLNTNAIVAADRLLVPVTPGGLSEDGFQKIAVTLGQLVGGEILGTIPAVSVLLARMPARRRVAKRLVERVASPDGRPYHVFERHVRARGAIEDLFEQKKTSFEVAACGDVALDYAAVAGELLALLPSRPSELVSQ